MPFALVAALMVAVVAAAVIGVVFVLFGRGL
jgi:hypothetical protein